MIESNVTAQGTSVGKPAAVDWLMLGLIALAPFIFAVITFDSSGDPIPRLAGVRSYSLPITAIEMVVIVFAVLVGSRPLAVVLRLPTAVKLLLATLVAIAIGTAVFVAPNEGVAFVRTLGWFFHLLFGLSLWRLLSSRWSALRPLVWPSIVAGVILYILVLIVLVLQIADERVFNWKNFWLGVSHIRQVGFYSVVGTGSAIGLAAIARNRSGYWAAVAAASLCLALSYWSGTRGSIVAVAAAFVAGFVLLPAMRSVSAIGALVCANVAGALISLVHQPPNAAYGIFRISQSAAGGSADELTSGRLTMWSDSARAVLERPFFGIGDGQYRSAVPAWGGYTHPHNVFIQIAIIWGLVGLACFVALASILGWRFFIAARSGDNKMVPPFLVAGGLATMAMYEGTLHHPYPVMMMVIALAFVLSSSAAAKADSAVGR